MIDVPPTHSTSAAARLNRLPISGVHRQIVVLLAYIFFFELGDLNSFSFAAPALREHWHLSIATIGRITAASFVGMFVGATTGGWFSDRVGRKRALILVTMWYSAFSFLNACVWNTAGLVATRLLTGVGLSAMTVIGMTYIAEMFPANRRGGYQARILTIGLCGIPATAYVARFLIPVAPWGWRAVFIWGSLALLFPFVAGRLEESPLWYEKHGRFADADAILNRIEDRVRAEGHSLPPALVAPAVAAQSSGFRELVSRRSIGATALLMAVWMFQTLAFYGFNSWVPTLLAERGFSIARSLEQSSAMSIGAVPGAWIASGISDRWERRTLIGIVSTLVGTLVMVYGLSDTTIAIVVLGFMVAMSQQIFSALLYGYTPECFPTEARNTGAGVVYGMGRLANAFGPFLVTHLFTTYGYTSVFEYIAVCWGCCALLVTIFGPLTRGRSLV